jgi:hypothetical protein
MTIITKEGTPELHKPIPINIIQDVLDTQVRNRTTIPHARHRSFTLTTILATAVDELRLIKIGMVTYK